MNNNTYKIVLASNSPRRKQILDQLNIEYEICPSNVDEKVSSSVPMEVCQELATMKAMDVASSIKAYNDSHSDIVSPQNILVIGADTIVAAKEEILGKPIDENDATRMLRMLENSNHSVFTGVSFVFISKDGRVGEYHFYEESKVYFYPMDEDAIKKYIDSGEPMDKAGAYGIQGKAAEFVRSIEGDYYNVMGFPIARILNELKKLGVEIKRHY